MAMKPPLLPIRRLRIGAFDGFVLAGALVNVAVVVILLVYWILT
jgi:hypothetical protein